MPNLFDLPSDLSISILRDWLVDIESIVALDSAAAKSVRSEYLGLVGHRSFVLPAPIQLLSARMNCMELVQWINNRMVKLSTLEATVSNMQHCVKISFRLLTNVSNLAVRSDAHGSAAQVSTHAIDESFRRLLNLLPSLTAVGLGGFGGDSDVLAILSNCGLPLTHSAFKNVILYDKDVVSWITSFKSILVSVDFGSWGEEVDVDTLTLIAFNCRHLSELRGSCKALSSVELLAAFGPGSLPLLKKLVVSSTAEAMTNEVARAIFQHHPFLTNFTTWTNGNDSIDIGTCIDVILLHPQILLICTEAMDFLVIEGWQCAMKLHPNYNNFLATDNSSIVTNDLIRLSSQCKGPIRLLHCEDTSIFAPEDLCRLLTCLGNDLKSFFCGLERKYPNGDNEMNVIDVHDTVVEHAVKVCPNLERLHLYPSSISDRALEAIGDNCKHVTDLFLGAAHSITDFGLCRLLHKIGDRLTKLNLRLCDGIGNTSLLVIVALCTQLKALTIINCTVSVEAVKRDLIVPNRLSKLIKLCFFQHGGAAINMHIGNFISNPESAVDKRWIKVWGNGRKVSSRSSYWQEIVVVEG